MVRVRTLINSLLLLLCLSMTVPGTTNPAYAAEDPYRTALTRWDAAEGDFSGWTLSGVVLAGDGALRLDSPGAQAESDPYPSGGYRGHDFYNGGNYFVGAATGPVTAGDFAFAEAIASWNADTPTGTWVEAQLRAKIGARWTNWYNMGVWASTSGTIRRHSVDRQSNGDGRVDVDTLVLKSPATAFQLRLRLFTNNRSLAPGVSRAAVAVSTTPQKPRQLSPGDSALWGRTLNVRPCSQMVYREGGEAWCSPTSTSMVLAYWQNNAGSCAQGVRAAVAGVTDWVYDGEGNWAFNAAYAGSRGLMGNVARFTSLAQAERWVAAGVPVVMSYAWKRGELAGAPIAASNGHLAVLIGFDAAGNPIINDPAGPSNRSVKRTYRRAQFESLWLEHSGGTVYLIYPPGRSVPDF